MEGPKTTAASAPDLNKIINQELLHFEATNELGVYLTKILNALKTIQPKNTVSERAFSSSSNFCTKRRSRMSDKSLNTLCFLKSYFLMIK